MRRLTSLNPRLRICARFSATIASTSLNETPAARRNSSASFFAEPPLQQPHAEQWPVQATLPLSTGWVRR